jgi:hypothetical protein
MKTRVCPPSLIGLDDVGDIERVDFHLGSQVLLTQTKGILFFIAWL